MGRNDLGSYFKNRIKGHSESIDASELIQNMGILEEKKEPKRRFIIFWFIGFLLFVGIGISVYLMGDNKNPKLTEATHLEKSNVDLNQESNSFDQEKTQTLRIEKGSQLDHKLGDVNKIGNKIEPLTSPTKKASIQQPVSQTNSKPLQNNLANIIESPSKSDVEPIHFRAKEQSTDSKKVEIFRSEKEPLDIKTEALVETDTNIHKENSEKVSSDKMTQKEEENLALKNDEPVKEKEDSLVIENDAEFESTDLDLVADDDIEEANENNRRNRSIGLYAGFSQLNRTMRSPNVSIEDHLKEREFTEKTSGAVHLGLDVKWSLNKRLYGKLGFEYVQLNEQFEVEYILADTFLSPSTVLKRTVILSSGDTIPEYADEDIYKLYRHNWKTYNEHKFYTIPISFGFEHNVNKVLVDTDVSLILSYYEGFSGYMLNPTNEYATRESIYFKPKLNIGYRGSVGLGYALTAKAELWLRANIQAKGFQVGDKTNLNQDYSLIGILASGRYAF